MSEESFESLTPEQSLEAAHQAIKRLDETIQRIESIIGERRRNVPPCQRKSSMAVIISIIALNVTLIASSIYLGAKLFDYQERIDAQIVEIQRSINTGTKSP